MPDPTIDGGSPSAPSFSLVPVDHDPFNNPSTSPSFSLVPVDHDPFAVGSTAQPATSSSNDGFGAPSGRDPWDKAFGAPDSQYQLSPLGRPGQSVSKYDVAQALKYPFSPPPIGALGGVQGSSSGSDMSAMSALGAPIAKPGQTIPIDNPLAATNAARVQVAHVPFPGLTDYLTKPVPPPSLVANAAGKLPPTDNPYAVPALIDVGATLGPLVAEKLGGAAALAAARGAPTLTRPPVAPNLLAEAYHNTFQKFAKPILEQGLNPGTYATTGQLSPLQAQIDLALPPNRGLANSVLRIDLAGMRRDGLEIPPVTQVARKYGMPGGGSEMYFPDEIPPQYIQVVPDDR